MSVYLSRISVAQALPHSNLPFMLTTAVPNSNDGVCHRWASAPGTAIPSGFMGIVPTKAGYARFDVKPQPGNVTSAQILLPTLAGALRVGFEQVVGKVFKVTLQPPANTLARVCLPKLGSRTRTLKVDSVTVAAVVQGDYLCVGGIGSAAAGAVRQIVNEK